MARTITRSASGRLPRRRRRGLGLADTTLAVLVLSALALYVSQVADSWMERRLIDGEARALAQLARAGAHLVESDPVTWTPAGQQPEERSFASLEAADLWTAIQARTTPGLRRDMTLWLSRPDPILSPGRVMVIARARGERIPRGLPGSGSGVEGVGAIENLPGETLLRGPDLVFDMADLNAFAPGFAQPGDLFALAHVHTDRDCSAYLFRVPVAGCPNANRMETDLDLNGNGITAVGPLRADVVETGRIEGDVTLTGSVSVDAGLDVDVTGDTVLGRLNATSGLTVTGTAETGRLTVTGNVNAAGTVSAAGVSFSGDISVFGDAVFGNLQASYLNANSVAADSFSALSVGISTIYADRLTVNRLNVDGVCHGC